MTLDKLTRTAVLAAVRSSLAEANEIYAERWLTGDQLCKELGFFTKGWLSRYGSLLPREQICITDYENKTHATCWCYPKNRIQRMISEGALRNLTMKQA